MIPIRNRKKTLKVTVEEMRNFAFTYIEKYAPSKQQLKTYLLKKYLKISNEDVKKKDVNNLIDIVLSDLEKNRFINDKMSVIVEQVSAMPGQGVTSMFNFGQSF